MKSATSKTGLLPTLKRKNIQHESQGCVTLELSKFVVPAPFTLRPFAGIYNPFPYGCSILCNHPADFEAKTIVKKAKDAWASEGKSLIDLEELSVLRSQRNYEQRPAEDKDDNVPEELFRKYTDTDSRPVTPTPTLASAITRNLRIRRCITPDPTSFKPLKEKTLLILDLRRSHSQETVCWPSGQADEQNFEHDIPEDIKTRSPSPTTPSVQLKKKKTARRKPGPPSATTSSLKTQTSKDSDSKVLTQQSSTSQSPSKGSVNYEQEIGAKNQETPLESSTSDVNVVKRRGKKTKKGKKSGKGDKEFQGIPDPRETQVSALEDDSKEGSSRQSLADDDKLQLKDLEETTTARESKPDTEDQNPSFLTRETLRQLQRQLDQEVVDSEFNTKRKIALEEALKHKKNPKHGQQEEMKNLKKEFQILIKDSEKWLSIPRVFTRRSARFELPMDSRILNSLTPLQYVQKYVFASPERLVLYNHVFNLYKEDPEDDEERDRAILGKNVIEALGKVMGRSFTPQEAKDFKNLINWKEEANVNFRTFTGISATCERLLSPQFCSKILSHKEDPRHEIEIADFETLDEKLLRLSPDRKLEKILRSIRSV